MDKRTLKRNMIPMKLAFWYNIGTLILFLCSSWNYKVTNYPAVIAVVLSCQLAMYMGYYYKTSRYFSQTLFFFHDYDEESDQKKISLLFWWTVIAAVIALPDMLYNSRMWTLSFAEIMTRLKLAFTQSNLNYSFTLSYVDSGTLLERVVVLIDVFLYFFKFAVLPLTIFYWHRVSKAQKVLCLYVTLMDIIKWLLKGMNKGIFDFVFVLAGSILLAMSARGYTLADLLTGARNRIKKSRRKMIALGFIMIALAVMMFVSNDRARSGGKTTTSYYSQSMEIDADKNSILMRIIPSRLHGAALGIDMYLTNGYQGLSYALRIPFRWCYGIGNNQFLISNFRDIFKLDVSDNSYLRRIEKIFPWQEWHNWHSIYTWLANDVSFYLLPVLFFFFGVLFASSWIDSVEKHNPYATVIYALFIVRIIYMPANNQVLSLSQSFIAWYIALIMWFLSRRVRFTISSN